MGPYSLANGHDIVGKLEQELVGLHPEVRALHGGTLGSHSPRAHRPRQEGNRQTIPFLKFTSAVSIPPLLSAEGARTIVQVSGVHQKEVDILFLRKVLSSIQASRLRQ